jgi:phosphate-selective porin OprO/OprP
VEVDPESFGMRTQKQTIAAAIIAAAGCGLLADHSAFAQSAGSESEIVALKRQLLVMQQKLEKLEQQTNATAAKANKIANLKASGPNAAPDDAIKGRPAVWDTVVKMPNNRPTICTADDLNCVSITSRLHFDAGGYDYQPNTPATDPQRLDNGVNARRARIGVVGKFLGDWEYALIYDFGGSSDGFASTASAGGTAVGFLPGGALSGIENAYLSYVGLHPFGSQLAIQGGYMNVPYTLEQAMSSNNILFMERSSAQVIAASIAAGDNRSAFGARWYDDRFWAGAYVTGPTSGAIHSGSSTNPNGTTEQAGAVARAAGQIISGPDYSLHLGADAEFLIAPEHNQITGAQTLTLRDRPELRIDPTEIVSTGAIAGVSGAQVYSVEAAATYGPLFFQGEYYWFNVDRGALPGLTSLKFDGGYAQASWVLTGETHTYNSAAAAYNGIVPIDPFLLSSGGWGAWEIAGRVSMIDLNDQLAMANGVAGGKQIIYTAGLNWYVNRNVRFMFNYLHGDIAKQASATNSSDVGAKFNAFAMRTQVAF